MSNEISLKISQLEYADSLVSFSDKLKINKDSSRAFATFKSANKLKINFGYYEKTIRSKGEVELKTYGAAQIKIMHAVLKIQEDAIRNNAKYAFPSLNALALAAECSVVWVVKVLKKLLPDVTFDKHGRVRGKLSWIVNPFAKVREYLDAKVSDKNRMIKNHHDKMFDKYLKPIINKWVKYATFINHATGEVISDPYKNVSAIDHDSSWDEILAELGGTL